MQNTSPLRHLPNFLIGLRIALVPLLWGFALANMQRALAVGLVFALLTDILDGQAARWLKQSGEALGRFDSLADKILMLSVFGWLLLLHPAIILEHPWLCALVLGFALASWLTGLLRVRRVLGLHLYLAKLAGIVQGIFVFWTFWQGSYSPLLLYLAVGSFCLAAGEEILVQLWIPEANSGTSSILTLWRRK